jgi:hypothetical protein
MAEVKPSYAQINRKVWNTCQFRSLSPEARELFFYLTTCPHGNMLGIFVLRPGYALDDLQWGSDRERFMKPFRELLDKGLFKYDPNTEIILDMEQLEKHPPINPNQVIAIIKIINSLPKTILFHELKLLAESLNKPLLKPLIERLTERYAHTVTVTVTEAVTVLKEGTADAPFELPTKEEIQESSDPKLEEDIGKVCQRLYEDKIFPEVNVFKNKMRKNKKNLRAILHVLSRCYLSKPDDPWAFCQKIIQLEDLNYNERDYRKAAQ